MFLFVVAALVCIVATLIIYARWEHGSLEKLGVPIVKHHPLLGSTREIYASVGGLNDCKWREQYGKIFGVYEGREAQLFVCVPELIRQICMRDADYFHAKRPLDFLDPVMNELPGFQPLEKWKVLRSLATPAFTSAKIRLMSMPMREATLDFVSHWRDIINKTGKGKLEKFAVDSAVHTMLTDLISRCVFSMKIHANTDENNEFAKIVKEIVTPVQEQNQSLELILWSHTFPFLRHLMPNTYFGTEAIRKFNRFFKQMMAERKKRGQRLNDVVDMCIEWMDRLDSEEFKRANVTEVSLLCQALVFFFASQDQICTMVGALIYHMIQNPELEKKLYNEVDAVFAKNNGKIEHEQVPELVFLIACLNETLRLYPFFHRLERVCTKDWKNEEYGLHLKKGTIVLMPLWAVNRDPDNHEDPDKFIPERFMPENKDKINPYSSTAFGHGPRNCTGKRFAQEAVPLITAHLLKEFKFLGRKDTELKFTPGGPLFAPHAPVHVDVILRK